MTQRTIFRGLLMTMLLAIAGANLLAADKPAAKTKFPAPVVDKILKGWGQSDWGSSLEAFKKLYPDAKQLENHNWVTGKGEDELGGVKVTAQYSFNKAGLLNLITFDPEEPARATFVKTLVEAGVLREGGKPGWKKEEVSLVPATIDKQQFVVAVNAKFTDAKAKTP